MSNGLTTEGEKAAEAFREYTERCLAAGICIELDESATCPHCTESKPIYYDGHLQVEIRGGDLCIHCVTSDFGRVYYQLEIKHCPECGREL